MDREWIKITSKDQWLSERSKDVTSTEVGALYSMHDYLTLYQLYQIKRGNYKPEINETPRMRAGSYLEGGIAAYAANELGCEASHLNKYCRLKGLRMGTSFDYEITNGELKGWLIECKLVDPMIWRSKWTETSASHQIEFQVQHQLAVSGRPGVVIAALVGSEVKLLKRKYNESVASKLIEAVGHFWSRVDNNNCPQPDYEMDSDCIIAMLDEAVQGKHEEIDSDYLYSLLSKYDKTQKRIATLEAVKKELKAKTLQIAQDNSAVTCRDIRLSCGITSGEKKAPYRYFRVYT